MSDKVLKRVVDIRKIKLNNGQECPALGLGTWQSKPGEVEEAVKIAIDVGYRHIDCAMLYGNENEIGKAIRDKISEGVVRREDLFIVTKLWNTFHEEEKVVPACKKSLENFQLDYVDQYLIHWPVAQKVQNLNAERPFDDAICIDYDYVNTWKGMEMCVELGLTKSIGLSNFNSKQIARILNNCKIKPATNQIEVNLNINNKKLINFCKKHDISVTAYSPFGSPTRPWKSVNDPVVSFDDPKLIGIGKRYDKTSAQIMLRYLIQIGTIPIPKSIKRERLIQNADVFDFQLNDDDLLILDGYNRDYRSVAAETLRESNDYPFNVEY